MQNWFLVTSAVAMIQDGLSEHQRLTETLATIHSIRQRMAHAKIVILETSSVTPHTETLASLSDHSDGVLIYHEDHMVQMLHHWAGDRVSLIKSPNEALILSRALDDLCDITPRDRIFKISGRYQLTDDFSPADHVAPGSITVLRRQPAVTYYSAMTQEKFPPEAPWQYKTRLYSFCASLRHIMRDRYMEIFQHITELYHNGRFNDIEHCVFLAWQDLSVHEVSCIGVGGIQVPSLEYVSE